MNQSGYAWTSGADPRYDSPSRMIPAFVAADCSAMKIPSGSTFGLRKLTMLLLLSSVRDDGYGRVAVEDGVLEQRVGECADAVPTTLDELLRHDVEPSEM